MADRLTSMVDLESLNKYLPSNIFTAWIGLEALVRKAQASLEKDDADAIQKSGLPSLLFQVGYFFANYAEANYGVIGSAAGDRHFAPYDASDMKAIERLGSASPFGIAEGEMLLYQYYKLGFALFGMVGNAQARANESNFLNGKGDDRANQQGQQMANNASVATTVLGLMQRQSNAKKVNAIFYPEKETSDFRQGGAQMNSA